MMKRIALWLMIAFYVVAGINHFANPKVYLPLIPHYLPWPAVINVISGIAEILLGLLLIFRATRKLAVYGIMAMLIAFIPAHVYFIQMNSCVSEALCTSTFLGWLRLIVIHPILLAWAWWVRL